MLRRAPWAAFATVSSRGNLALTLPQLTGLMQSAQWGGGSVPGAPIAGLP